MPKKPTSPAKISPPDGWKDGEGFGLLWGHDAQGHPVDLVRLADLVRWLQARDRLTFSDAVKAIIDPLPDDVMGWLYGTSEDAARLIDPLHLFGYRGIELLAKERRMAVSDLRAELSRRNREYDAEEFDRWNGPARPLGMSNEDWRGRKLQHVWPQEPGRPALLRYLEDIRSVRPAILDSKADILPWLAIPREKAHALWGWGGVDSVGEAVEIAGPELAKALAYDWTDPKTIAAFLRDFDAAPGVSQRKKSRHLAATEKWGRVGAETLRKKAAALKSGGKTSLAGKKEVATPWSGLGGSTQRKGGRTG